MHACHQTTQHTWRSAVVTPETTSAHLRLDAAAGYFSVQVAPTADGADKSPGKEREFCGARQQMIENDLGVEGEKKDEVVMVMS